MHSGYFTFTIGQKALLSGMKEKHYVVAKDVATNKVFVAEGFNHPSLYADQLLAFNARWISGQPPPDLVGDGLRCSYQIRHLQPPGTCVVTQTKESELLVTFNRPQRAIAPRQVIAFYQDRVCLGGAVIKEAGPSYWNRKKPLPSVSELHV